MPPSRFARLFPVMLLAVLLAGCLPAAPEPAGGNGPAARSTRTPTRRQPGQAAATEPTTITWSFWGDPWQVEINRRVARAFEAENPAIKVELLHRPWAEYFTWLESEWQQGRSPDVMFLNYIPARVQAGQLEPLDTFLERDRFVLSDFYPRLLEQFEYQGSYYGLPRDNDTKVIYYNKSLLMDAGLAPPASGWTWTDLREAAQRLTKRDSTGRPVQYGFAFESETWWTLFVWQNGGDLLDDPFTPRKVRLGEPAAVEAIQFLADLIHVDGVTPLPDVLESTDRIKALFREGKLAMALGNHALVPSFAEESRLRWDVATLPAGRERANFSGGAGCTIGAKSPNKDAAWALVRFLCGLKGQALFAESGVIVPARRSVRQDSIFLRQQPYNTRVFAEETEYGRPSLNAPVRTEVVRVVEPALRSVWNGERTAAQAIEAILPELRRIVER